MDRQALADIAVSLVQTGRGILAADESNSSAGKRLESIGLENTPLNRRRYRDLFLNVHGLHSYLSGVILYDETFWQESETGATFTELLHDAGVIAGIKVDQGLVPLPASPDEMFTQGLDGLEERLDAYREHGARFTKWRAVFSVDPEKGYPSEVAIQTAATQFSLYAGLVQKHGMVPIIEPEVLMDGVYTIEQKQRAMERINNTLFTVLSYGKVFLPGAILKTSFVLSGSGGTDMATDEQIAQANREVLEKLPAELGGVVFLSGGLSGESATRILSAVCAGLHERLRKKTTFSFARAIQGEPLSLWAGRDANLPEARLKYLEILKANVAARHL